MFGLVGCDYVFSVVSFDFVVQVFGCVFVLFVVSWFVLLVVSFLFCLYFIGLQVGVVFRLLNSVVIYWFFVCVDFYCEFVALFCYVCQIFCFECVDLTFCLFVVGVFIVFILLVDGLACLVAWVYFGLLLIWWCCMLVVELACLDAFLIGCLVVQWYLVGVLNVCLVSGGYLFVGFDCFCYVL